MADYPESIHQREWDILIQVEPRQLGGLYRLTPDQICGISQNIQNIFAGKAVFALQFIEAHAGRQLMENDINRDAGALHDRLSKADTAIHRDSVCNFAGVLRHADSSRAMIAQSWPHLSS